MKTNKIIQIFHSKEKEKKKRTRKNAPSPQSAYKIHWTEISIV